MNDEIVNILKKSEMYQQALLLANSTYDLFEKAHSTKLLKEKGFVLEKESASIKVFIDPETQLNFFKNANEMSFISYKKDLSSLGITCVVFERTNSGFLPKRIITKKECLVPGLDLGFIEIMPIFRFSDGFLNLVTLDIKSFNHNRSTAFAKPEKISLMFEENYNIETYPTQPAQKSEFFNELNRFFFLIQHMGDTAISKSLLNYMVLNQDFPIEQKEFIKIMHDVDINQIKSTKYIKNDISESEKNKAEKHLKI